MIKKNLATGLFYNLNIEPRCYRNQHSKTQMNKILNISYKKCCQNQHVLNGHDRLSGNDYRVATLSKSYITYIRISCKVWNR